MATATITECSSCKARIFWALTEEKRKRIPIDEQEVENGNIIILEQTYGLDVVLIARYVREDQPLLWEPPRYVSHFATCPDKVKWRRQ